MDLKLCMFNYLDTLKSLRKFWHSTNIFDVLMTSSMSDFFVILQYLQYLLQYLAGWRQSMPPPNAPLRPLSCLPKWLPYFRPYSNFRTLKNDCLFWMHKLWKFECSKRIFIGLSVMYLKHIALHSLYTFIVLFTI